MQEPEKEEPVVEAPAKKIEEPKPTNVITEEFVMPEDIPDAAPEVVATKTKTRYVRQKCNGAIPKATLAKEIRKRNGEVRACYERALKTNPSLEGRVVVGLRIEPSGKVSQVNVGGSLRNKSVNACVRSRAARWRFANPSGKCADVQAPFGLSPRR